MYVEHSVVEKNLSEYYAGKYFLTTFNFYFFPKHLRSNVSSKFLKINRVIEHILKKEHGEKLLSTHNGPYIKYRILSTVVPPIENEEFVLIPEFKYIMTYIKGQMLDCDDNKLYDILSNGVVEIQLMYQENPDNYELRYALLSRVDECCKKLASMSEEAKDLSVVDKMEHMFTIRKYLESKKLVLDDYNLFINHIA